jgi:dTDP-4-amino-4,6-dideoxygalactose transaminase
VVTSHEGLAEELRSLRQYGQSSKYQHERLGYNARLDSLQAAVLEVKLRHLDDGNRRRRAAAAFYSAGLKEGIGRPGPEGVFHLYVIRVHNRDQLQKELGEVGIETGIHYPIPLHLQPCFRDLGHAEGDFPVAERMAREILSLPIYPQIREDQLAYVVEQVNRLAEAP